MDIEKEFTDHKHTLKDLFHKALLNHAINSAGTGIGAASVYYVISNDLSGSLYTAGMITGILAVAQSLNTYMVYRDEMKRTENLAQIAACFFPQADKPDFRPWPWNCLPTSSQDKKEEFEPAQRGIPPMAP